MKRLVTLATPVGLFSAALLTRLVSWHSVFQETGVHPNGYDAYYHLRRIRYSVEHFPDVLHFDPLINYPYGGQPIWSPAFDWLIAATLVPVPGILEGDRIDRLAVWFPPVLGALTVVLVYFMLLRFFSRRIAVLSGLALVVLPGHAIYSRLGFVDHHVLVALVATAMLWIAMELFREQGRVAAASTQDEGSSGVGVAARRVRFGLSVTLGFAIGSVVLVWPGALLHVGVLQLALVVRLLCTPSASDARARAADFGLAHAVAALVVYPFAAGKEWVLWGNASPVVLSDFQPLYLFAAAFVFGGLAWLWRSRRFSGGPGSRVASAVGLGAVVCAALLWAIPDLLVGIEHALSWFSKDEEFQSVVNESQPLFWAQDGPWRAHYFLGSFAYLAPFLLAVFAWRSRGDAALLLLTGWAAAFFTASLVQWRFVNTCGVVYGVLIAWSLVAAWDWARARTWSTAARRGFFAVLVLLTAIAFVPTLRFYRGDLGNILRRVRAEPTAPIGSQRDARFLVDAARFLRAHSPPIDEKPYSVIGPWGAGHVIKYIAERPVLQDNFGDDVAPENFALVEAYYSAPDEEAALALVAPVDARYVMVHAAGSGHSTGYSPESMLARLYGLRGQARGTRNQRSMKRPALSALERHRLIYQSREERLRTKTRLVMLFEIVEGAQIEGRAKPGSAVRASLRIHPRLGSPFDYEQSTIADDSGRYRMRVPYSNESQSANVRIDAQYRLISDHEVVSLSIPEAAVSEGRVIEGPQFGTR